MATIEPRVHAPGLVSAGEIFEVRTVVSHMMETGLRRDESGQPIARKIINRLTCRYDGVVVFDADLREAVAANPYVSFYVRAGASGTLQLTWQEDGGAAFTVEKPLTVSP